MRVEQRVDAEQLLRERGVPYIRLYKTTSPIFQEVRFRVVVAPGDYHKAVAQLRGTNIYPRWY